MWNNNINELVAELKVPWDDLKVLSTPSKELDLGVVYVSLSQQNFKKLLSFMEQEEMEKGCWPK